MRRRKRIGSSAGHVHAARQTAEGSVKKTNTTAWVKFLHIKNESKQPAVKCSV
jgi:hypothetical protein